MTEFLATPDGRRIAYDLTPGTGPGVVFLGGFKSDKEGSKALYLEEWARGRGRAFLRFDYSGHGQSSGRFEEGAIGDWAEDAASAVNMLTTGPQILVGSSMGGWIAALFAKANPGKVAGFVGIAAAPDFTEDGFFVQFSPKQKAALYNLGHVDLPSDYGEPYRITRRLIEDGRNHLVLRAPLPMPFPVRLLQGTGDTDVTRETALAFFDHIDSPDSRLTFVRGADHRFSSPQCLDLITATIEGLAT
ncbi:MAG: alpha/beta hydrolase [Pseudomonadota bacterium]